MGWTVQGYSIEAAVALAKREYFSKKTEILLSNVGLEIKTDWQKHTCRAQHFKNYELKSSATKKS